jgi:hypothetical protein
MLGDPITAKDLQRPRPSPLQIPHGRGRFLHVAGSSSIGVCDLEPRLFRRLICTSFVDGKVDKERDLPGLVTAEAFFSAPVGGATGEPRFDVRQPRISPKVIFWGRVARSKRPARRAAKYRSLGARTGDGRP